MNRRTFLLTASSLAGAALLPAAATSSALPLAARFGDGRDWWFQKRFGMFVHWGLYSIHGFHEQEQWRARVPRAEYEKLAQQWNPVHYNPDRWLDLMQEAGMKYICLTTKHHDGFCLFDTKLTTFNTMNTPYRKDVVRMLADACHRRGVPLCLYYSIADWHQPNYPNQGRHHELAPQPGDSPSLPKYLDFLRGQVRELCSNYGEIHGFWWDMNVDKHVDPSINDMIRQLQPKAVINNRGFDEGDFGTPERDFQKVSEDLSFAKRTEACQSVGMESWGYRKNEDFYSDRHLLRSIDAYLSRDANYLLNVGPDRQGVIPEKPSAILRRIGSWYRAVRESLEGTVPASNLTDNRDVLLTRRDNTIYVHLWRDPVGEAVKLKPIVSAPRRAILMNTGRPVEFTLEMAPSDHVEHRGYLRLRGLPVNAESNTLLVVRLDFDRAPELAAPTTTLKPGDILRQ